jgi:hypothetical protein
VIVASLLLILVAVMLLVLGLAGGSSLLLVGSIVESLLAAVALVVGARQAAAARSTGPVSDGAIAPDSQRLAGFGPGGEPVDTFGAAGAGHDPAAADHRWDASVSSGADPEPAVSYPTAPPVVTQPAGPVDEFVDPGRGGPGSGFVSQAGAVDEDPPDEPAAEEMSDSDAVRLTRVEADVVVVDGRPRYHRTDCVHLLSRQSEPLPVREALELGFTPCSLCEPNRTLLAQTGRV